MTDVGAKFLRLLQKHFPPNNPLHRLFNRNNAKVSYGCLPSIKAAISKHNNKIMQSQSIQGKGCNCRGGVDTCPVRGQCLVESVVYTAEVKSQEGVKMYIGSTEASFKDRYTKHKSSFKLPSHETDTRLSIYIWNLKHKNIPYSIYWRIVSRAAAYCPESKKCSLCLVEKAKILFYPRGNLLNKRTEVMNFCRHRAKHKLATAL